MIGLGIGLRLGGLGGIGLLNGLRAFPLSGVNLEADAFTYYGRSFPLIDRSKSSAWFQMDRSALSSGQKTTTGYPTVPWRALINVEGPLGPAGVAQQYVILTNATGTITPVFGTQVGSETTVNGKRRIVFNADNPLLDTAYRIEVTGSAGFAEGQTFAMIRADQEAAYLAGQTFNPTYLTEVAKWGSLRFMDWLNTNENGNGVPAIVNWSDRTPLGYASYGPGYGQRAPFELCVALMNAAGVDGLINVPARLNDAGVAALATMVRDNLRADLRVNFETANEWGWNYQFGQTGWAAAQSPTITGANSQSNGWAGYRAAQNAATIRAIFGTGDRRNRQVLAGQQVYLDVLRDKLKGVQQAIAEFSNSASANYSPSKAALFAAPSDLFDYTAGTTYISGALPAPPNSTAKSLVESWANANNVTAALNQLRYGNQFTDSINDTLAGLLGTAGSADIAIASQVAFARSWGMEYIAYEGGPHLNAVSGWNDADPMQQTVATFFSTVEESDGFAQLTKDLMDGAFAAGMIQNHQFSDIGAPNSKYGNWYVKTSLYAPANNRFNILTGYNSVRPTVPALSVAANTTGNFNVGASPLTVLSPTGGIGRKTVTVDVLPAGRTLLGRRITGTLTTVQNVTTTVTAIDEAGFSTTTSFLQSVQPAPVGKRFFRLVSLRETLDDQPHTSANYRYCQLAEIRFKKVDGTVISFSGAVVSGDVSSVGGGAYVATNAIDGDPATVWIGPAGTDFSPVAPADGDKWMIDLRSGNAAKPATIEMQAGTGAGAGRHPGRFRWEWSDDGVSWITIYDQTSSNVGAAAYNPTLIVTPVYP